MFWASSDFDDPITRNELEGALNVWYPDEQVGPIALVKGGTSGRIGYYMVDIWKGRDFVISRTFPADARFPFLDGGGMFFEQVKSNSIILDRAIDGQENHELERDVMINKLTSSIFLKIQTIFNHLLGSKNRNQLMWDQILGRGPHVIPVLQEAEKIIRANGYSLMSWKERLDKLPQSK